MGCNSNKYTVGTKVKRNVGGVDSVYGSLLKIPNIAKIPESEPTYGG